MSTAVCIYYTGPDGTTAEWKRELNTASSADGICRALDIMEAEGVPVDAVRSFAIIAKPMPDGAYLLPPNLHLVPAPPRQAASA